MNDSSNTPDACTDDDPRRKPLMVLLARRAAGTGWPFVPVDPTVDEMLAELGWPRHSGVFTAEIAAILAGAPASTPKA